MIDERLNIISLDARLLLEKLIKILPFPAYVKDSEGHYLICNEQFADNIFGIKPEELANKTVSDFNYFLSKEEADFYRNIDDELIKNGGVKQFEAELLCADGINHYFHEIKTAFAIDSDNSGIIGIMIDLTETKEIKKAYAHQEKFLKIFMDYIPDAVFFKDRNGKYLKVNSAEVFKLGFNSEKAIIGKTVYDFYPKDKAKKISQEEEKIISSGKILNKEQEVIFPDGKKHWVHTTKVPFPDEDGEIAGLFGISRDITNKKKNEQDLKYKFGFEKILSKISHNLMKIGYKKFEEGLIYAARKINKFFKSDNVHFFLFESDELRYSFSLDTEGIIKNIDKNKQTSLLKELSADSCEIDYEIVNDNYSIGLEKSEKNEIKYKLYLPFIKDNKTLGAVIIDGFKINLELVERNSNLLNILTEILSNGYELYSMELERTAIETQMHKMVTAVEQSANIVMILNLKGRIEYINQRFYELTKYPNSEVIGRNPLAFVISTDKQTNLKTLWPTIKSGKQWSGIFLVKTKDEKKIWLNTVISPICDGKCLTNFLAIIEDVTEKINSQNQLAVSQKLEAIGQLAAGIAHEINSPMQFIGDNNNFLRDSFNSILSYVKELEEGISNNEQIVKKINELKKKYDYDFITEEIPSAIEQSADGIERVSNIVNAMKEFAHPGTKAKAHNDINKAIRNTVVISKNEWKYCSELKLELDENLPLVYCQIDSINQVILNMIVNAAHAIEDKINGSDVQKGEIIVSTSLQDDSVIIKIKDSGCGIPKENLTRIFDPFFTTKEVGKGTGQGLAIAHDIIVNKHHGEIKVESEVNVGTEFTIILPIEGRNEA